MTAARRFAIGSAAEAAVALDYFNGFHDGFMQRIVVTSHDRIEPDRSQLCTGQFHVAIDFAHYNYADGAPPPSQLVHGEFEEVQDPCLDLRAALFSSPIIALDVRAARRRPGAGTTEADCLALVVTRHYYVEAERRWELREATLFTFARATLAEPQAP
jgi:hypothetical protein